jgi:hypothetical protein
VTPNSQDGPSDAEIDWLHSELERQFARVGVSWAAVEQAALAGSPMAPAGVRWFTLILEYGSALHVLRELPDGAGSEAFLAGLEAHGRQRRLDRPPDVDRDV